jgi:hypothetical protein
VASSERAAALVARRAAMANFIINLIENLFLIWPVGRSLASRKPKVLTWDVGDGCWEGKVGDEREGGRKVEGDWLPCVARVGST